MTYDMTIQKQLRGATQEALKANAQMAEMMNRMEAAVARAEELVERLEAVAPARRGRPPKAEAA